MTELDSHNTPLRGHRALRFGRWSEVGALYFLTFRVRSDCGPVLRDRACAEAVLRALHNLRIHGDVALLGYVIMPDHVHLMLTLRRGNLANAVMRMRSRAGHSIRRLIGGRGPVWQRGFYDHLIRDEQDWGTHMEYIHGNPVRAGLVTEPEEWLFSSAHPLATEDIDHIDL